MKDSAPQPTQVEQLLGSLPDELRFTLRTLVNSKNFGQTVMGNRTSENVVSVEDVTKVLDEMFVVGEEALPHHRDKFQKAIEQYQQHKATVVEILGQFFPEIRGSQDTNKLQAFIEAI